MPPTLYARKEPSTDEILLKYAPHAKKFDVSIYSNNQGRGKICTFRWDLSNKPTRRNRYVTINCYKYKLEWLTETV